LSILLFGLIGTYMQIRGGSVEYLKQTIVVQCNSLLIKTFICTIVIVIKNHIIYLFKTSSSILSNIESLKTLKMFNSLMINTLQFFHPYLAIFYRISAYS